MHIKAKLYPYPVLSSFNDDYKDSKFNIETSIQLFPNELLLQFRPILENKGLQKLINEDKASFLIHMESALTSFRKILTINNEGFEYRIPADKIEGPISFCPFIIATQDIVDYKNELFNKDYEDLSFALEKGNILALGNEVLTRIEKENDDLANVPSIFAVTEIKDKDKDEIIIDNTGHKINIQLPAESFFQFKLAMNNPSSMSVIYSMVIIPALMKCFDDMKSKPEELFIYEDRRWYRALKKAMKKVEIELSEDTIRSIDSFKVAQRLMDNTTNKAILSINEISHKGDVIDD